MNRIKNFSIRRVASNEAEIVAGHRVRMLRDMGHAPAELRTKLKLSSDRALSAMLASGEYVGWFAVSSAENKVIAGAGVHIKAQLPRISLTENVVTDSPVPLVVNVYTEPAWRSRGVARRLMKHLMAWAFDQKYDRVVLHASVAGRPLYTSLGFEATNQMRWVPAEHNK